MSRPTLHLFSFGFKYSGPPRDETGHGGGFVFDCRALPNPYWEEALRPFPGTDPRVIAFFEAQPDVAQYARHAVKLVIFTMQTYAKLEREHLQVAFGCTGGRHRSVYLAEWMKWEIEALGFPVVLAHCDLNRDAQAKGAAPAAGTGT